MESTGLLIVTDISLVFVVIYFIDPNVFHAIDLLLSAIPTAVGLAWFRFTIGLRLWIDRKAFIHRGPLGRLWNEYVLWRIRNNPAYRELFNPDNKV